MSASPPPAPATARATFTKEEEMLLVKYLAIYNPGKDGRSGNAIYKKLVENAENKWSWSGNHTWQSWRNKYVKEQDRFDNEIIKYQLKQRLKAKESKMPTQKATAPGALKRSAGSTSAKQSPVKRRKVLVDSSGTESSPNDNDIYNRQNALNSQSPQTTTGRQELQIQYRPGGDGRSSALVDASRNYQSLNDEKHSASRGHRGSSVLHDNANDRNTLFASDEPHFIGAEPVDGGSSAIAHQDTHGDRFMPESASSPRNEEARETYENQSIIDLTNEDMPQNTSTPRFNELQGTPRRLRKQDVEMSPRDSQNNGSKRTHSDRMVFSEPENDTIIKEELDTSHLPQSPARLFPRFKTSSVLVNALTQLNTVGKDYRRRDGPASAMPSPIRQSPKVSATLVGALAELNQSQGLANADDGNVFQTQESNAEATPTKQAAARLSAFIKRTKTGISNAVDEPANVATDEDVQRGEPSRKGAESVMNSAIKDNTAGKSKTYIVGGRPKAPTVPDTAVLAANTEPTDTARPTRNSKKLLDETVANRTKTAVPSTFKAPNLRNTFETRERETESDDLHHVAPSPSDDDQSSTRSAGEQKLEALVAKKRGLLHYSNGTLRTEFADESGRKRRKRIPDLDSSDDEEVDNDIQSGHQEQTDWPPARRRKVLGAAQIQSVSKPTAPAVNGAMSKPHTLPRAASTRHREATDELPGFVAGPSNWQKDSKDQDEPRRPRTFVDDVTVAAMQSWRAQIQPLNEYIDAPELPSFGESEPLVRSENPQRTGKGKEKVQPDHNNRRQTFGGFPRVSPLPRVDFPLGRNLSADQATNSHNLRNSGLRRDVGAHEAQHSRRSSLASTIDVTADFVPLTHRLSETDQQLASNAGLQVLFRGMAENHGFSEEVVKRVWEECQDILATDELLREMREVAEQFALERISQKRNSSAGSRHNVFSSEEPILDLLPGRERLRRRSSNSSSRYNALSFEESAMDHRSEREGARLPRYSGASLRAHPLNESETILNGREKYSPPPVSRAAQFVRLATQGRVEEAVRRESRRSRGMNVFTPARDKDAKNQDQTEPMQNVKGTARDKDAKYQDQTEPMQNVKQTTEKSSFTTEMEHAWTADEDAILMSGDDGALEILELRMGRGSIRRRMAELIGSNRLAL